MLCCDICGREIKTSLGDYGFDYYISPHSEIEHYLNNGDVIDRIYGTTCHSCGIYLSASIEMTISEMKREGWVGNGPENKD